VDAVSGEPAGRQGVCILGATGSIGTSTLDVVARHPERFRVVALTAHSKVEELVALCRRFRPDLAAIGDGQRTAQLADALRAAGLRTVAVGGPDGLIEAARLPSAHCVVAAIVGAAGLRATLAAAREGKRVLLANKEAIVCAGSLLMETVRGSAGTLLPVDSEHNAIHQCLAGARETGHAVRRLILTASGGPFLRRADLSEVTPEQACAHPKWNMGRKISVDSATLMNKGLEVIEASRLFDFAPDRIDVLIHPQSVIHSMVEFVDGSVLAQMGTPDMRTPIAYSLGFPERIDSGSPRLDFLHAGPLQFEAPDQRQFPCLGLAYQALRSGPAACIAVNAANEVAVESFLNRELPFARIAGVIEDVLAACRTAPPDSVEAVLDLDGAARRQARSVLSKRL
jgi:1-deoxy-D-xylulose-5-phosphate reductoisomerase